MTDLYNLYNCKACSSDSSQVLVDNPVDHEYGFERKTPAKINRCGSCSSIFQTPWPSLQETASFYGSNYQNYASSKIPLLSKVSAFFTRRAAKAFLRKYGTHHSILDFGCGHGAFISAAIELGATDVSGFDLVEQTLPTNVNPSKTYFDLEKLRNCGRKFDLIRMNHVIEHLSALDEIMLLLSELLAPNGRIVGQTPCGSHYTSKLMKSLWGPIHYPYHLVLFSREGLEMASGRWNLRLANFGPTLMPTGWAMSFENLIKDKLRIKKTGRLACYTLLLGLSAPFAILDLLRGDTAVVDFELQRLSNHGNQSQ